MTCSIGDRLLWVGVGALAYLALHAIYYATRKVKPSTELDPIPPVAQPREPSLEDSISNEDLSKLVFAPENTIANAAISVLCRRFVNSPENIAELETDLLSSKPQISSRAATIANFLSEQDVWAPTRMFPALRKPRVLPQPVFPDEEYPLPGWYQDPRERPYDPRLAGMLRDRGANV